MHVYLYFLVFGSVLKIITPTGSVTFEWDWIRTATSYHNLYYEPQTINFLFLEVYEIVPFYGSTDVCLFIKHSLYYSKMLSC